MAEVVHALEETIVPMQCVSDVGASRMLCNHELDGYENCATKLLWTRVQGGVERVLEQTTLAELGELRRAAAPRSAPSPAAAAVRARAARAHRPTSRTQEKRTVPNG